MDVSLAGTVAKDAVTKAGKMLMEHYDQKKEASSASSTRSSCFDYHTRHQYPPAAVLISSLTSDV